MTVCMCVEYVVNEDCQNEYLPTDRLHIRFDILLLDVSGHTTILLKLIFLLNITISGTLLITKYTPLELSFSLLLDPFGS